ncbi:nitrogenase molybdenum-iron protein alpha chain [bacterium BMS3Bbin14]|nr:nitrogenase molybdenum-iron protein alpha chain [bacterium BMS3Abin13]GBE53201.1 nitrogenase molybdenum-iron protein alpha chain [bacterium BMS3Bbin14]HDK43913.1 nitrogenase iron-molybdenum cofactor biosynthesis protein NifE [Desulfobacteraceae bacterium]HDL98171.1 nitrogenase iron-molybdenum cofactor biosynthesis protein NifE [Desulfobacteraceae bacterium]HDO29664.1 nitrogenase iron-molybdenum cofactor biosynthesis protein NifE [Desulfobacteraceae bacterium]
MEAVALKERENQIYIKGETPFNIVCDKDSLAGAVSQRACVFCGSRVVLYPIADALHLVHGPIGCAVYTWDIRGALSSGPELHRLSFSTDLQEMDVIFGGEKKLRQALLELIDRHNPKAAFVYSTCIVGIIGDDLEAICRQVEREKGIPVIPVKSEGFKGNKRAGYQAACDAMFRLIGTGETSSISKFSLNILGDFNLAGEIWMIREYYERMGIEVVANITGDGRVDDIRRAHGAALNVVQCSGSTMQLANMMEEQYGVPSMRVSYFGVEDMSEALYDIARFFKKKFPGDREADAIMERTTALVKEEVRNLMPGLEKYRKALAGKKAAIYVGGSFKAFSLVKAFRLVDMEVVLVGSQTGTEEDYRELEAITDPGTIIVDDSNPLELTSFLKEKGVDIFVGGVKERPIAYKLGIGFCDHNHERKEILAGFEGMLNFAREVYSSVMSPVWRFVPRAKSME